MTRPCPAMMPLSPSTNTGLVQPNSRMLAAICATWASECVRGLRAYGISSPSGRQAIARSSILRASQSDDEFEVLLRAGIQRIRPREAGYPPPEFRGHKQATARPVPAGRSVNKLRPPGSPHALPQRPSRAVFASWQGLQAGAQLRSSQNSAWSPRCGTTWSTTVAGTTRPWARQAAHSGCCARNAARARRQRGP